MEDKVEAVTALLSELSLLDKLEVIANLLIVEGVSRLEDTPSIVNAENVVQCVLDDLEKNGENVGNSLARQGLAMLAWIDRSRNDDKEWDI